MDPVGQGDLQMGGLGRDDSDPEVSLGPPGPGLGPPAGTGEESGS